MCFDSTVFLIDDDAAVRDALSISLSLAGLKNEVYSSGKAFLDAYTRDRPGCLLINLSQSEMDGLAVQQELSRRNFPIPIIFMTGIGIIQDSVPAMQPGVFCLLEKPFPRTLLLESIRKAMEQDYSNRSDIKNQSNMDNSSEVTRDYYKQPSPSEREFMAIATPRKWDKPIALVLGIAMRNSALCWAHLTELGTQFTLCAGLFFPAVQL